LCQRDLPIIAFFASGNMVLSLRSILVGSSALAAAAIPMNSVNFGGGLRLTVNVNPEGQAPQETLLDTGSSSLAFCDSSLESSLKDVKTDYLSCNAYGSGGAGYWGFFYSGQIGVGQNLSIDSAYYSVMHTEVSMPCGSGLQGIFGVGFKSLDQAANHASALNWTKGTVGSCPATNTTLVGPLMSYLKQDTPQGRLGIYWNGAVGNSTGELYVGATAESNSHYTSGTIQTATLGETGYYDIVINQFSFGGETYKVSCNPFMPCLVDTGTPIMFVPSKVYEAITNGSTGSLTMQLAGPNGTNISLNFDAQTLAKNKYIQPYSPGLGSPHIIGLPLWAFYYTVFNVDGRTMDFVEHSASELLALKDQTNIQKTMVAPKNQANIQETMVV